MSRCFPFPPPGYEKKISTDEASDSLLKEKQKKEKKHKKDKERKEGKEKKDKETSKDKHKDRKEKKEKHKDKKNKDRDKGKSRTTSEDRKAVVGVLQNTGDKEKVVTNTVLNNGNGESKFIQDLARRIRDEEEATESKSVGKISIPNGVRENNNPISQNNHKKVDEKRSYAMERRSENGVLRVSSSSDKKGPDFMVKSSEKKEQGKKKELQEKKNHSSDSVTKSDNKNGLKYTANRKSEEEKTEAVNKIGHDKPKYGEGWPRLKDIDVVDTRNFRAHDSKNLTAEGVLGKRKDLETNGFLHENGSRPNKIQRPAASPVTSVENGRKLGACQTLPKPVTELQGPVCNPVAKEHRINGFIGSQEPKSRPTTSSVKAKENSEASAKKRPHPDLKYLDLILNVPQREELHEVGENEEQEWLFGHSEKLLKKPKTDFTTASLDESLQVWNQALRLESTDTVALPYVVPF
ncbi:unnamed protein product [Eruca vesicaria subsp. sativa]|uniref:Myb-like protein X n=1 Tax=Eruca vesicaria subsp. sativa TaxID=29727 RepID=A0ABC8K4H2_ERUVS|nr:unnamed protein product [Eruca vesicaria subsp. sativa]